MEVMGTDILRVPLSPKHIRRKEKELLDENFGSLTEKKKKEEAEAAEAAAAAAAAAVAEDDIGRVSS